MVRRSNPNIDLLERTVGQLGYLIDKLVFLGGCATGLLITDSAAPPIRATGDVDVITEVASYAEYTHLPEKLRERGFAEDSSPDAPICRWTAPGIVLDVMPTDDTLFDFSNEWLSQALESSVLVEISEGVDIKVVTAPCFLATKLAAFFDRGRGDYAESRDLEDIVAVLDGRPTIVDEVEQSEEQLRVYIASSFGTLMANRTFMEALPGHLPPDAASQGRFPLVRERIELMMKAGSG